MKRLVCVLKMIFLSMSIFCFQLSAETKASLAELEKMVQEAPKQGDIWVKLGFAYLEADEVQKAKDAFNKGIQYAKSAEAYTGLGMAYAKMGKGMTQRAFQTFRQALGVDPLYAKAQMEIAKLHIKLGNQDAEMALLRTIGKDPMYQPAYQALILWYEQAHLNYETELIDFCKRYIERFPDDAMGYYHLALVYVRKYEYGDVVALAKETQGRFGEDLRWLAIQAQAYAARGDVTKAVIFFEGYLRRIGEEERTYYNDLSLVATKDELEAFQATSVDEREDFLNLFWSSREGALMLGGDARRVEHYRRVWYARTFFGQNASPWDKRGEVYVRYGEPDYRSSSRTTNELPPPAVQLVKERKIARLMAAKPQYRASEPSRVLLPLMMPGNTYYPGGYYDGKDWPQNIPSDEGAQMDSNDRIQEVEDGKAFKISGAELPNGWMWEVLNPGGVVSINLPLGMRQGIEPAVLIDRDAGGDPIMPWESWVYLNIGRGKEFVFTDRYMSGNWDFPLTPATVWHTELVVAVNNAQPALELMQTASELPEHFDVPPGVELLEFYYDMAGFRGDNGKTKLEVYFAIPPEQVDMVRDSSRVQLEVGRAILLAETEGDSVYEIADELVYQKSDSEIDMNGLFVDVASLNIPPGKYTLGVKLADRLSGRWGMYRQEVDVASFADSLSISDIAMAWKVSEDSLDIKFKKDDIWVVPAPTRSYAAKQDALLYYEVYNLTKDSFGQARYKVTYTIKPNAGKGTGIVSMFVGGVRQLFLAAKRPEYRVSYERVTDVVNEPVYFALETWALLSGLKQVAVQVEDLNSGQVVSQEAIFRVAEASETSGVGDMLRTGGQ